MTLRVTLFAGVMAFYALFLAAIAQADGYRFGVTYTGDVLRNMSGGIRTGTGFLDNLDLTLEVDVAQAWKFGNGTLFVYGLYNNGTTFSDELVGDLQVVSNIDAAEAWRIYQFWYEIEGEGWSLRSGLYDLNSEFDAKETGAIFLNSSHGIGPEFSQSGKNGPGIFPVSSLALRAEIDIGELTTRFALLDGVPGNPDNPASNAIDLSSNDGVLAVGEIDIAVAGSGRLWAGYWRYSADFDRPYAPGRSNGNDGWYIGGEQQFSLGDRTAAWYLRYGEADQNFYPVERFVGGGFVVNAPFAHRQNDQFGLGIAIAIVGDPYKELLNNSGAGAEPRETIWELTYRAQINDQLALQPDIQYIQGPSSSAAIEDSLVLGLRFEIAY